MEVAVLVLEYLKVILSWPVISAVVAIVLLVCFREDIKSLMTRIAHIRFPGGSEIATTQLERSTEEKGPAEVPEIPHEEAQQPIPLPSGVQFSEEQLQVVRDLYFAERANSYLWEYRYLNFYLARHTQLVLDWLYGLNKPVARTFFENFWNLVIPSPAERNAVLLALQNHYLIMIDDAGLIQITPKGREYTEWRGPLPQLPTQTSSS